MQPAETIAEDLLCIRCEYNLRTLSEEGRCPECGLLVADTLKIRRGSRARARLLSRRRGVALLLFFQIVVWLLIAAATLPWRNALRPETWLGTVVVIDLLALMTTATLLLEAGSGRAAVGVRNLRRATTGFGIGTAVAIIGTVPMLDGIPPSFSSLPGTASFSLLAGLRLAALALLFRAWATGHRSQERDRSLRWAGRLGWLTVGICLLWPALALSRFTGELGRIALTAALLGVHAVTLIMLMRERQRLRKALRGGDN